MLEKFEAFIKEIFPGFVVNLAIIGVSSSGILMAEEDRTLALISLIIALIIDIKLLYMVEAPWYFTTLVVVELILIYNYLG